jgi:hypothetical protein
MNENTLFEAVGLISDETITEAQDFKRIRKPRHRFWSVQYAGLAAATLVMIAGTVLMLHFFAPDTAEPPVAGDGTTAVSEPPNTSDTPNNPNTPGVPLGEYVWIVEPALEFYHEEEYPCSCCGEYTFGGIEQSLFYCRSCDVFHDGYGDGRVICERTGQLNGEQHGAKTGSWTTWVYDPQRELLGSCSWYTHLRLYPVDEFAAQFPEFLNQLVIVHEVDSSLRLQLHSGSIEEEEQLLREAYTGRVAVMRGGEFITDFDFAAGRLGRFANVVSLARGGKHGVLNHLGETVVPFEFDSLMLISDTTAFARIDGKWGIIGFNGYVADSAGVQLPTGQINRELYAHLIENRELVIGHDSPVTIQVNIRDLFPGFDPNWTVSEFTAIYGLRHVFSDWAGSDALFFGTYGTERDSMLRSAFTLGDDIFFNLYTPRVSGDGLVQCSDNMFGCTAEQCKCLFPLTLEQIANMSLFTAESRLHINARTYYCLMYDIIESATRVEHLVRDVQAFWDAVDGVRLTKFHVNHHPYNDGTAVWVHSGDIQYNMSYDMTLVSSDGTLLIDGGSVFNSCSCSRGSCVHRVPAPHEPPLDHPNFLRIYDFIVWQGVHFANNSSHVFCSETHPRPVSWGSITIFSRCGYGSTGIIEFWEYGSVEDAEEYAQTFYNAPGGGRLRVYVFRKENIIVYYRQCIDNTTFDFLVSEFGEPLWIGGQRCC